MFNVFYSFGPFVISYSFCIHTDAVLVLAGLYRTFNV
jgi:hypothetical protein